MRTTHHALVLLACVALASGASSASCTDSKTSGAPVSSDGPSHQDARDDGGSGEEQDAPLSQHPSSRRPLTSICESRDYGHTRSNQDYFLRLADDTSALEYSQKFLAAEEIRGATQVARDPTVIKLVARVYDGFRKLYPRETEDLDEPPRVIVLDADGVNAFTGYDDRPEQQRAPWLLWVHRAAIESSKTDAELAAIYAHELAHLVTRDVLPETREHIRVHYRVPGQREHGIFGATAEDDPIVRAPASELRSLGHMVGRAAVLGALPLSAFETSEYASLLDTLMQSTGKSSDSIACFSAASGLAKARSTYRSLVSVHDLTLTLTESQANELGSLAARTESALRTCYGSSKTSVFELKLLDRDAKVLVNGVPAPRETVLDPTTEEHKVAYDGLMTNEVERSIDEASAGRPTIDRLLDIVKKLHARVAEVEASSTFAIDEVRVFDLEEDADDVAARVLSVLGMDAHAGSKLFLGELPNRETCESDIRAGVVPRYGRFVDPHNATCWRAFHVMDFASRLDRCPSLLPSSLGGAPSMSARDWRRSRVGPTLSVLSNARQRITHRLVRSDRER